MAPAAASATDATLDAVAVGGGPAGATAATELARRGRRVVLLDRQGKPKACGGAIPPRLIEEFDIPDSVLCARVSGARVMAPSGLTVEMPIRGGFVAMVDRAVFDEWLRARAAEAGAERIAGTFESLDRDSDGTAVVVYRPADAPREAVPRRLRTRFVIGADGARSAVARQALPDIGDGAYVIAYHEIVRTPPVGRDGYDPARCDVVYRGDLSPDFYGWMFPHGDTASVGVGTARPGFALKESVRALRVLCGLADAETVRGEGAPIPLRPLKRWDNGRDVVLAGDAAGVVAPASGEGIYYAMAGGRLAAEGVDEAFDSGDPAPLARVRKRFMKAHGGVFRALGFLQGYWYASDERRERFVAICQDVDLQNMIWQSYMNKKMMRASPRVYLRIIKMNIAHMLRLV